MQTDDFATVYRDCLPAISAYLIRRVDRSDVDDLAADVFAIAYTKRGSVTAGEELPWLYRIASYVVSNHRRRLARRASFMAILAAPDSAPAADAMIGADPDLAAAWRVLRPAEREILGLAIIDEVPVGDLATALGISANAVSVRLHRAKKALAAGLDARAASVATSISTNSERSVPDAT